MEHGNVIVRFQDVTYGYDEEHPTLEEASFSVREDSKITLMGQNGAGKSTLFKLMLGQLKPLEGKIHIRDNAKIAIGLQVMAKRTSKRRFANTSNSVLKRRNTTLISALKTSSKS
jgi:ATPase subunit of ABC transporter with duplicated ATPase domains